jgi:hypothetical protein
LSKSDHCSSNSSKLYCQNKPTPWATLLGNGVK